MKFPGAALSIAMMALPSVGFMTSDGFRSLVEKTPASSCGGGWTTAAPHGAVKPDSLQLSISIEDGRWVLAHPCDRENRPCIAVTTSGDGRTVELDVFDAAETHFVLRRAN